jgi:hypothetical protein
MRFERSVIIIETLPVANVASRRDSAVSSGTLRARRRALGTLRLDITPRRRAARDWFES